MRGGLSALNDSLMASSNTKNTGHRPSPLRSTRSFPRSEPAPASPEPSRPKRASTLQNGPPPAGSAAKQRTASAGQVKQAAETDGPDTFESRISEESAEAPRASVDMEGLPIELISLTDSFIDSLSAKTRPSPPSIDTLSGLFQDFYATASSHIQTHLNSLATRQRREGSPAPSNSSRASAASLLRAKAASLGSKEKPKAPPASSRGESEQQMLTAEEYADRKKARKSLEQQRVLLEEAVERRLCEGIYDKIYRHRTTQDEAQDDKLRSKTAALSVVGIGLVDLGVEIVSATDPEDVAKKQEDVKNWLEQARKELVLMNKSRYPLGKLNHLKAAHKSIIDTLSHFHPSSSADELMPMLIYTLITMPPENLNVISDLNFIQRFRWEPKLFGETAYCLTNLEATISFLETVDLSTLRADEAPTGPVKAPGGNAAGTPRADTFPPAYSSTLSVPTVSPVETTPVTAGQKPFPGPAIPSGLRAAVQLRNRRLSDLVNTPVEAFNAASDAVLNTADQGLKTIGMSLGDSYKFLIGKLREHPEAMTNQGGDLIVPKTLEDARKLIGTPPPSNDEDAETASGASSIHSSSHEETTGGRTIRRSSTPRDDKMLNLISGRKVSRDHSADSARSSSASSLKKGLLPLTEQHQSHQDNPAAKEKGVAAAAQHQPSPGGVVNPASSSSNPAIMDSMRNLGSSLNPMSRFSGIGPFKGFGRTSATSSPAPPSSATTGSRGGVAATTDGVDLATAFPELAPSLPPKEPPKFNPPIRRFMEIQNPGDLRIGEVLDLLRDYRRLAGALKDLGAFKE
ncbi:hypothetical protein B0H66DRAFT_601897 [Apodospora peruviana]|uniref:VPS9 domain-containing protein n=1 Tax=Apodospora peruviana TaxID=516989 RepID=A0AAE0IDV0_9PEZI|nr:hypothetical protein B0H66DRAFT_601897 [Apodospora peruviana]